MCPGARTHPPVTLRPRRVRGIRRASRARHGARSPLARARWWRVQARGTPGLMRVAVPGRDARVGAAGGGGWAAPAHATARWAAHARRTASGGCGHRAAGGGRPPTPHAGSWGTRVPPSRGTARLPPALRPTRRIPYDAPTPRTVVRARWEANVPPRRAARGDVRERRGYAGRRRARERLRRSRAPARPPARPVPPGRPAPASAAPRTARRRSRPWPPSPARTPRRSCSRRAGR